MRETAEFITVPDVIRGADNPDDPKLDDKKFAFKSFTEFIKAV